MGILTDIFIATEAEVAAATFADGGPAPLFPTVQAKGIDPVALANLAAILGGGDGNSEDLQAAALGDSASDVARDIGAEEGGPEYEIWIARIPPTLVAQLAALASAEVKRLGEAWANTFWRDTPTAKPDFATEIVAYLAQLRQLAAVATAAQKTLFLWICL